VKLEGDPKDRLVLYLDEADSRNKVEQFLVTIQV
jgi:hypothetical protein